MAIKNAVGRPPKFNMKTVNKVSDLISHNYSVNDACQQARISKNTFYRYLKSEPIFKEEIDKAKGNRNKVSFNFRTYI